MIIFPLSPDHTIAQMWSATSASNSNVVAI